MPTTNHADSGMNGGFSEEARFAALSQRVSGIEQSVQGMGAQLSSLISKLDERGKPQWGIIFTGLGVLITIIVVIGGMAYMPIQQAQTRLDRDIVEMRMTTLGISSFNEFKATYENNRLVSRNENNEKFGNINSRIENIESRVVPREELDRVFASYDEQLREKQRQLDEIKAASASVYGARDAMMDMRDRIDRLEARRLPASP